MAPRVLLTRPRRQTPGLSAALAARGIDSVAYPMLRIAPVADPAKAVRVLDALCGADPIIFISANAVDESVALRPDLFERLGAVRCAVLGAASERALRAAGFSGPVLRARGSHTEDLLALEALRAEALDGTSVGLVRGQGGRALLARTLRERGARVREAVVYRRFGPEAGFDDFLAVRGGQLQVAVVTSAGALENLLGASVHCVERVLDLDLVLPSHRVARRARELGFRGAVAVPETVSDAALADAAASLL